LQIEIGAGQPLLKAGCDAGTHAGFVVVFGLTGGVDAAKASLNGKADKLLGGSLLPRGSVDDSRDANFAGGDDERVHGSARLSAQFLSAHAFAAEATGLSVIMPSSRVRVSVSPPKSMTWLSAGAAHWQCVSFA
jgi:hypothetical protein